MTALFDSITRIARHEAAARATAAIGVVTSVHGSSGGPADHAVSLQLRDSGLVLPQVPVAVGALGFVATPAVGDLVIVVFTDGDLHGSVVVGRLYHTDLDPPAHDAGQHVLQLPPGDEPAIDLTLDPGVPSFTLTVGEVTAEIGERTLTVTNGDITLSLDADGSAKASLAVGEAELSLAANGDVAIKAAGALTLEGNTVEIKGQSSVAIKGATVDVN